MKIVKILSSRGKKALTSFLKEEDPGFLDELKDFGTYFGPLVGVVLKYDCDEKQARLIEHLRRELDNGRHGA